MSTTQTIDQTDKQVSFTTGNGSQGFIITNNSGALRVEILGTAELQKMLNVRLVKHTRKDTKTPCTVNGKILLDGHQMYFHETNLLCACFVELKDSIVTIDMATEGNVCIDYDTLFTFDKIVMNKPVSLKVESMSIPVDKSTSVMYNGKELDKNLYELRNGKHYLHKSLKLTEQLYLCMEDGTFTDIDCSSGVLSEKIEVYVPYTANKSYEDVPPLMRGIRGVAEIPVVKSEDAKEKDVSLTFKHFTGEVTRVFRLVFLSNLEYHAIELHIEVLHELLMATVNYATMSVGYEVDGELQTKFETLDSLTKLTVQTADDVKFFSYVYRTVKDTVKFNGGIVRTLSTEHKTSNKQYIINGLIYATSNNLVNTSLNQGDQFSTYNQTSNTWSSYDYRGPIVNNERYDIILVDEKEHQFNLNNVGNWLLSEAPSFEINNVVTGNIFNITEDKVGVDLSLKIKFVDSEFTCTLKFTVDEGVKKSLLIDGEENFLETYTRRASFFSPQAESLTTQSTWLFGRFVAPVGETIHAYQSSVKFDGEVCTPARTKFPVITHGPRSNKLVKTVDYIAELLTEDKIIELGKNDTYLRMNATIDTTFRNSTITVSGSTGLCMFFTQDKFHIYRSDITRKRSGHSISAMGSFSNSTRGSPMSSPTADNSLVVDVTEITSLASSVRKPSPLLKPPQLIGNILAPLSDIATKLNMPQTKPMANTNLALLRGVKQSTPIPSKPAPAKPTPAPTKPTPAPTKSTLVKTQIFIIGAGHDTYA